MYVCMYVRTYVCMYVQYVCMYVCKYKVLGSDIGEFRIPWNAMVSAAYVLILISFCCAYEIPGTAATSSQHSRDIHPALPGSQVPGYGTVRISQPTIEHHTEPRVGSLTSGELGVTWVSFFRKRGRGLTCARQNR